MTKKVGVAAAAVMLLAGCAGSDGGNDAASSSRSLTKAETSKSSSKATSDKCEKITKSFGQAILDGAPEGGNQLKYVEGSAVKSSEHKKAYYVAITFDDGTGLGEETGVWAATNLKSGPFQSVDGFATEFTQWPDASTTEAGMTVGDKGSLAAKGCIN